MQKKWAGLSLLWLSFHEPRAQFAHRFNFSGNRGLAFWPAGIRRSGRSRKMKLHRRVSEQNPSASYIVVGGPGFCLQNQLSQRLIWMTRQLREKSLIHGSLWRLFRKSRRGPDRYSSAFRRQQHRFRQALSINILEESIQTIHHDVDGQSA